MLALWSLQCMCGRARGHLWEHRMCLPRIHYHFLTLKTGANSSSFCKGRKTSLYLASKSSTITFWFWSLSLLNLEVVEVVSATLVVSFAPRLAWAWPLEGEDSGYVEVEDVGTFMFLPEVMSSPYPCWWAKAYAERRELVLRTLLRFCSWGPCRLVACWSKRTCGRANVSTDHYHELYHSKVWGQ